MAAEEYSLQVLKSSVAQIATVIGWTNAHASALDVLTEITKRFLVETGQHVHRYSEQFGRTQPSLDDIALAFEDMEVSVEGLEEYLQNIQSIPPAAPVPAYPVSTQSQLNFMKPGSREVLTRPVHIQEYLPPMNPSLEDEQQQDSFEGESSTVNDLQSQSPTRNNQMKRPGEANDSSLSKRLRIFADEDQRVREITSVMMTTSGFISEAREGKLPEARLPMPFFDEEVVEQKPKKAPPMKRILEGVKKIEPVELKKKVKQEPPADLPPSPAPAKKVREKKTIKPEVPPVSDVGYTVKPLPGLLPINKAAEVEKPPEKISKLNLFKKFLKGKEDKRPDDIDVESIELKKEPVKPKERTPSPPPRQRTPTPPPRTPTPPPPAPEASEKKKRKRKEKEKKIKEEVIESDGEVVEDGSPPPKFEPRNYMFPQFPVGGDLKQLPGALKNLPAGLLGIRPGGAHVFPVRPVFPPAAPQPPKERSPSPPPKARSPSPPPAENLMTSPISDTCLSDVQSPSGQDSPRKKKEKKKKEKKLKSKDKDDRLKDREEKLRLKEEKKQKREEKRALKKMKEEKEPEEVPEQIEKIKEKDREKDKSSDDALPKIIFKFGSPPPPVEKSPSPEPPPPKVSVKPPKKEREVPREPPEVKPEPPEVVAPTVKVKPPKKSPPKVKKEEPKNKKEEPKIKKEEPKVKKEEPKKPEPVVKPPTPKPPTPKPTTPKPPPVKKLPAAVTPVPAKTPEPKAKKEKLAKTPKLKEPKKEKPPKVEKSPKEVAKKKPADAPPVAESVGSYFDEEGNKIWICPTCGRQDDGTPMIGCDECDDWYHWVCVGIRVAPSESENWYCQRCLAKKKGMLPEKKKGKKKKGE